MAHIPSEYAEQFHALDQLRIIAEQEGMIANFVRARKGLNSFWHYCSDRRFACQAGDHSFPIEETAFCKFAEECAKLFLIDVPETFRDQLLLESSSAAARLATEWRDQLGDIEVLAIAELKLKTLMLQTLEFLSKSYLGEIRLPSWDSMIKQMITEIEQACRDWQASTPQTHERKN
jgi:hypothetical protein